MGKAEFLCAAVGMPRVTKTHLQEAHDLSRFMEIQRFISRGLEYPPDLILDSSAVRISGSIDFDSGAVHLSTRSFPSPDYWPMYIYCFLSGRGRSWASTAAAR